MFNYTSEFNTITPAGRVGKEWMYLHFNIPNPSTIKNIKKKLSCVCLSMSSILKWKWGSAKSLDSALLENEAGTLSANQNAGLQCKINSANQGELE